jgi:hypothetical protein
MAALRSFDAGFPANRRVAQLNNFIFVVSDVPFGGLYSLQAIAVRSVLTPHGDR